MSVSPDRGMFSITGPGVTHWIRIAREVHVEDTLLLWHQQADDLERSLDLDEGHYYGVLSQMGLQVWGVSGVSTGYGPDDVRKFGLKTCRTAVRISKETGLWPPPLRLAQKFKYDQDAYEWTKDGAYDLSTRCRPEGSDYHPEGAIWTVAYCTDDEAWDYLMKNHDSRQYELLCQFEDWDIRRMISYPIVCAAMQHWPIVRNGRADRRILKYWRKKKMSKVLHLLLRESDLPYDEVLKGIEFLQQYNLDHKLDEGEGEEVYHTRCTFYEWLQNRLNISKFELVIIIGCQGQNGRLDQTYLSLDSSHVMKVQLLRRCSNEKENDR